MTAEPRGAERGPDALCDICGDPVVSGTGMRSRWWDLGTNETKITVEHYDCLLAEGNDDPAPQPTEEMAEWRCPNPFCHHVRLEAPAHAKRVFCHGCLTALERVADPAPQPTEGEDRGG